LLQVCLATKTLKALAYFGKLVAQTHSVLGKAYNSTTGKGCAYDPAKVIKLLGGFF
jgi:hypothetical protein